jgi:hypothetical protein
VCHGGSISKFSDIALYQGKLYMFSKITTNLFVFAISEDDSGLMVSRVERCMTKLPEINNKYGQRWNIVEWHGKLLLVVRLPHLGTCPPALPFPYKNLAAACSRIKIWP